jgi:S-formylglutathione hydrolase FrmB
LLPKIFNLPGFLPICCSCALFLLAAAPCQATALASPAHSLPSEVASVEITIESEAMGRTMPALVLLPPSYTQRPEARYPVLYLLHSAGGDYRLWADNTRLIAELASREMIVVCPDGTPFGWYLDSPVLPRSGVETYMIKELIPQIDRQFRTIDRSSGRAISGFSMGGHGAITLAAKYPDRFASASSIGGILDLSRWPGRWGLDEVLGPHAEESESWLEHSSMGMSDRFAKEAADIKILIDCGLEDFALPENRAFHRRLEELGISHTYRERAGGHDLTYCSRCLPEHLDFHFNAMENHQKGVLQTSQ